MLSCDLGLYKKVWRDPNESSFYNLYMVLVFHLRVYCSQFTQNPLQDTDPILIEILLTHERMRIIRPIAARFL